MAFVSSIRSLNFPAVLPDTLYEIGQHFKGPRLPLPDIARAVQQAMVSAGSLDVLRPGDTVAVAVGSRGIRNLAMIVRQVIDSFREAGAQPFVVPAMGSHGGATAAGQRQVLADLGVTEGSVGAEIRSDMATVECGRIDGGPVLYQDAHAASARHTFLVARVKPHTDFHGQLESGLAKMCVIGLGKRDGATAMHAFGAAGFRQYLAVAARIYEQHTNVIGGLAILENADDDTAEIHGLGMSEIGTSREAELLERSRHLMAKLPFSAIDVLVVRQIGKDVSGTGMDTNIIGRVMIPRQPESSRPDVGVIVVLDLSTGTHGNAAGMGLANVTTLRVVQKTDWVATYTNAITSGIFGMWRVAMPITMPDDQTALQVALRCCGEEPSRARIAFIEDTLHLQRMWISASLLDEARAHSQIAGTVPVPLAFDTSGCMQSPWWLE